MVFFPTGSNFDQIGFLVLEAKEGSLNAFGNATGGVYSANKQLSQRIRGVLVNPVAGSGWLGELVERWCIWVPERFKALPL
ncbi:unnamed protein product [Linum trigynum]|uniref:Uncharacterized protein n=1 Tax=Linum trigynum TaxID=586398 RepID=A0AAV2EM02_9ROSI